MRPISTALISLMLLPLTAHAVDIAVPEDQPTIQAAIDIAEDGDAVIVSPGTYLENIDFLGKAILVTSTDGAGTTTIEAALPDPTVTFATGEGAESIVSGFTILNADGDGVRCFESSPTITGNVITATTTGNGGGIVCESGAPVISENLVVDCLSDFGGGILAFADATPTLNANLFRNCTANEIGGGLGAFNSSAVLTNNVFDDSIVHLYFCDDALMVNNTIVEGTILLNGGAPVLYNTLVDEPQSIQAFDGFPEVYFSNAAWGGIGAGNVAFAPQLVDPANGDYHLSDQSAAINFGTDTAPVLPDTDFEGDPRNICGAVDLGADESLSCPQQTIFVRGDANQDGNVNVADGVFMLLAQFVPGSPVPECLDSADTNDDGTASLFVDAIHLFNYLFVPGSEPIPPPHPECDVDPTVPDSVACASYDPCP